MPFARSASGFVPLVHHSHNPATASWIADVFRHEVPPLRLPQELPADVYEVAAAQGVITLLADRLMTQPIWTDLADADRHRLRKALRQASAREALLAEQTTELLELLAENQIDALLLKGTPLAYLLYPRPELRPRGDIDLLVRDREASTHVWRLLQHRGYHRAPAISGEFVNYQFCCFKAGGALLSLPVDVHWRLSNSQFIARQFSFAELWKERLAVTALGPHAFTLGWHHALAFALFHRFWHLGEGDPERLIWIYDLKLLCRQLDQDGWESFVSVVKNRPIGPICWDGLEQAAAQLGVAIPDVVANALRAPTAPPIDPLVLKRPGLRRQLLEIWALPCWSQRLRLIREILLPAPHYMNRRYGLASPWLLPWAYLRRGVRGLSRLSRR